MKCLLKENGVVVDIGKTAEVVENGILINNVIYAEQGLTVIETDKEVVPFRNTLVDGVVGTNPLWEISEASIRDETQQIKLMQAQQNQEMTDFMETVFTILNV